MTLKWYKSRVFWERVYVTFLSKEPFVCGEAAPCGRSHAGPENPAPPSKGPALRPLLVFGCWGSPPPTSAPCRVFGCGMVTFFFGRNSPHIFWVNFLAQVTTTHLRVFSSVCLFVCFTGQHYSPKPLNFS